MQTKEREDPNLKMFHGLHKDLRSLDKHINNVIGETLSVDTSHMPEEQRAIFQELKNDLPGMIERMKKSANPMDIYKEAEKKWHSK